MNWVVNCLHELEKKYRDNVAPSGGNRNDDARNRFFVALNMIIQEWRGAPLDGWVDTAKDNSSGDLPKFLEICFSPFKHNTSQYALVDAFRQQGKIK